MTSPPTYRYPGAKPFRTEEEHIFYGRDRDTKALQRLLRLEPLVVLYAKSGLGKSSLINAGLIPKVKESGEFDPFPIRFGAYHEEKEQQPSPVGRTLEAVRSHSPLLDKIRPKGDNSLWYHLKSRQLEQSGNRPLLLIFDQFEELFTFPEEAVEDFAS